jgi:leucyl aminopeptidase
MSFPSMHATVQANFDPVQSISAPRIELRVDSAIPRAVGVIGIPVSPDGSVPRELELDRAALNAAGFEGKLGQTLMVPRNGDPMLTAFGVGPAASLDTARLRDAAAALARSAQRQAQLAVVLPEVKGTSAEDLAQALVEGILLARYRYLSHKQPAPAEASLVELTLVGGAADRDAIDRGMRRGATTAYATALARDLANAPATLLTATRMAAVAQALADGCGLAIEIFDEQALAKLGCGGMLGVNAGSAEPPRLIRLTYAPRDERGDPMTPLGHVSLVGKGVMYDSGGISLKPNDLVHATMKGDMAGAAAVLAAMSALAALGCKTAGTGYLMCTDNMPSGSAMKLGDVLTIRGGRTVEVMNTDAEGRLVLADGLMLSTEQRPKVDAIVDIATLTGACQRALGVLTAGVLGNNQPFIRQVEAAAKRTDESVWQLPLDRRYKKELESEIADMKNVGGENAGAITAALFLEDFVGGLPWAHLDIAGTARMERDEGWRTKGATGFGTRLLIDLLLNFRPPQAKEQD